MIEATVGRSKTAPAVLERGPAPGWLTAVGAAKSRGVSRQYVVRCIHRGDLRGVRWGRQYLIDAADVAAWQPLRRGRQPKDR